MMNLTDTLVGQVIPVGDLLEKNKQRREKGAGDRPHATDHHHHEGVTNRGQVHRKIGRLAVGSTEIRPASTFYKVPTLLVQEDRRDESLPFGTRGGLSVRHTFPLDGEYAIRVDLTKDYGDQWRGRHENSQVDVRIDGARAGGVVERRLSGGTTHTCSLPLPI